MRILTPRFGELEIPEDTIVTFADGLPGFRSRRWVVFVRDETPMIEWLQSVDEPEIALMTMDPVRDLLIEYQPEPKQGELAPIGLEAASEATIRVIVRNADSPGRLSVNLFAPLFYNVAKRQGMQLPLIGSGWAVNELWPPEELVPSVGSNGPRSTAHRETTPSVVE